MHDWRGVNELLEVVGRGSFTKAAEHLQLSKSYVSRIVSDLEERLGTQLLFRNTRRLALTAAGEKFYQRCLQMRSIYADAQRELGELQAQPKGRLRIGLCDVFGVAFMSAIVAEFAQINPEVEVEVIAYLREDELRYEEFDALIRYGAQNESDMPMRRIGLLSYCLCASPEYLAQHPWPTQASGLLAHACLAPLNHQFELNDDAAQATQKIKVAGRWVSNSAIALAAAARRHLGIAQVPLSIILDSLDDGSLLVLDQEWAYLDKETWACFPAGPATAATHAFVDFISTRFEILRFRPEMRHHQRILQDRR